jgi:hypothetical protein
VSSLRNLELSEEKWDTKMCKSKCNKITGEERILHRHNKENYSLCVAWKCCVNEKKRVVMRCTVSGVRKTKMLRVLW